MEVWKPVDGYEGYYEVSNYGNVKSVDRYIVRSDGVVVHYPERTIHAYPNKDGYLQCKLNRGGRYITKKIHQLVATAFIENPKGYQEVNHIDSNRQNNMVENLEWIDHKSNVWQSINEKRHFCTRNLCGANNPNYRNTTLRDFYQAHPEERKLLSRPGAQNGRAKPIALCDDHGNIIQGFSYIGECATHLLSLGLVRSDGQGTRDNISRAVKMNKSYKGLRFKFI